MVYFVLFIIAFLLVATVPPFLIRNRWLFERNTEAEKLLLEMLDELADEDCWEWADSNYPYLSNGGYKHRDSGVVVELSFGTFRVGMPDGQILRYFHTSKGGRILTRLFDRLAEQRKTAADLNALHKMTQAFNRMNGRGN